MRILIHSPATIVKVMTTVHDDQVLSEGELSVLHSAQHDLPVDVIVTPTRSN